MVGFILTSPTASVMWLVWTVFRCSALARTSLCSMEIRRPVIMPKMCIVLPVRVAAWSAIQSKVLAGIMCAVFLGKPSIWSALAICFTTSLLKHAIFSRKLIAPSVFAWEKDSIPRPVRKIALCKWTLLLPKLINKNHIHWLYYSYYQCSQGVPTRKECKDGYYNARTKQCDKRENVQCNIKPPRKELLTDVTVSCPPTGQHFYPHPSDCHHYYLCMNGVSAILDCGPAMVYDIMSRTCNLPERAVCITQFE